MILKRVDKKVNKKIIVIADFLVSLNLHDDAIEVWDKYLQLYPKDKKAYEKMGNIFNNISSYDS